MQSWVVRQDNYDGSVKLRSQARHSFYSYSLWRANTGEHLFDGVAGDLAEAVDSLYAHIRYLSGEGKLGLA